MAAIQDIFAFWPSASELARELGEKPVTVRQWRNRGRVPVRHWTALISAAGRRGHKVAWEHLQEAHLRSESTGGTRTLIANLAARR